MSECNVPVRRPSARSSGYAGRAGERRSVAAVAAMLVLVPVTLPPGATAVVLGLAALTFLVTPVLAGLLVPAADPVAVAVHGTALALLWLGLPISAAVVLGPWSVPLLAAVVAVVTSASVAGPRRRPDGQGPRKVAR